MATSKVSKLQTEFSLNLYIRSPSSTLPFLMLRMTYMLSRGRRGQSGYGLELCRSPFSEWWYSVGILGLQNLDCPWSGGSHIDYFRQSLPLSGNKNSRNIRRAQNGSKSIARKGWTSMDLNTSSFGSGLIECLVDQLDSYF